MIPDIERCNDVGFVVSLQGSGVSCMAQPGAEGRGEVKDPVEGRWQQTSPLARQDARKNKSVDQRAWSFSRQSTMFLGPLVGGWPCF